MSKPFDSITRTLLETHPGDWLRMLGLGEFLKVDVIDSDLSTVTAEADKVLRVCRRGPDAPDWLVHVEVQAGYDPAIPRRLLRYNALLNVRHDMAVYSAVVLLWPEADGPAITGAYAREAPVAGCRVEFHYPVIRVWEIPAGDLAAVPGTLPLTALAARNEEELRTLAAPALDLLRGRPAQEEQELSAMLFFLIGRRFNDRLADEIFGGDRSMRESVTYQRVLNEGRAEEGRKIILRLATRRFGPPSEPTRARLEAVSDLDRLEALADRVLTAVDWDDLFAEAQGS